MQGSEGQTMYGVEYIHVGGYISVIFSHSKSTIIHLGMKLVSESR